MRKLLLGIMFCFLESWLVNETVGWYGSRRKSLRCLNETVPLQIRIVVVTISLVSATTVIVVVTIHIVDVTTGIVTNTFLVC